MINMVRIGNMLKNLRSKDIINNNIQTRADKLFREDLEKMIFPIFFHQCLVVAKAGAEAGKLNSEVRIIMRNYSSILLMLIQRTSKLLQLIIKMSALLFPPELR